MLRFRDLSLRKRLLLANFMMVAVPVFAPLVLSGAFYYQPSATREPLKKYSYGPMARKRVGTYRAIRCKFPATSVLNAKTSQE